jgi:hypothetical protein
MKDTGGPAFPRNILDHGHGVTSVHESGMTLRDYFAAKAMQASRSRNSGYASWSDLAKDAYEIADAMLAERSKP